MNTPAVNLSGLARRLVMDNLLTEEIAASAIKQAIKEKISLVKYLCDNNLVNPTKLANAASDEFGTPILDLSVYNMDVIPKGLVETKLIQKHQTLPLFQRGNRLYVAVADPTNLHALDEIKFHTGINTDAVLVEQNKLEAAIEKFVGASDESLGDDLGGLDDAGLEDLDITAVDEDGPKKDDSADAADETPIVRFINKVLLDAIKSGASDIHFEPYEKIYRIRFRTDGMLHEVTRPPQNLSQRLAARLKVMSQMDLSERRLPQDGRIKMKLSRTRAIDFRVNSLPTLWGEKIVLRILDPTSAQMGIDALGYEDSQKKLFMDALHQPQGMVLVTGPTGSGKTVSLYTGVNILNTPETNISTAEDPVEINLEGVNQVNVSAKVGLTFSEALRAFLRQDPDVILVGEIRDLETAEIAIKAAQTGHMVLSTLHTNSAPETLTRLMNMGVPAFNLATSINLIIAQRLARRLCSHCKVRASDVPEETVMIEQGFEATGFTFDQIELYHPKGCDKCTKGYKGRVGVYEVVAITSSISRLIMEGANSIQIADQAKKEGFNNLRISALRKAAMGLTSLEEVNRVTKD